MIIPTEEIIQRQNFEQLCERIKHLDIHQQTDISNLQNQQHYSVIPPVESISKNLPSINELLDYQILTRRIKELEISSYLQNQVIEDLRRENSELNERLSLLVQVEVNIQLESKLNQLREEFNRYKEELNGEFSRFTNDMKVVNGFFDFDNQEDKIFADITSKSQKANFKTYYLPPINQVYSANNNNTFSHPINPPINPPIDNNGFGNFENIHKEMRDVASEFNNYRDSLTERMNSLRHMIYQNQ